MGINAADRSGDIRGGTGMTRKEAVKFAEHAVNMTDIPEVKEFYRMAAVALAPPNEALTCEGCYYIKNDDYSPCAWCIRSKVNEDYYRRPPEGEEDA